MVNNNNKKNYKYCYPYKSYFVLSLHNYLIIEIKGTNAS